MKSLWRSTRDNIPCLMLQGGCPYRAIRLVTSHTITPTANTMRHTHTTRLIFRRYAFIAGPTYCSSRLRNISTSPGANARFGTILKSSPARYTRNRFFDSVYRVKALQLDFLFNPEFETSIPESEISASTLSPTTVP